MFRRILKTTLPKKIHNEKREYQHSSKPQNEKLFFSVFRYRRKQTRFWTATPYIICFRLSIQCHKKTNQNCHQKLVLKNHIFYWDISIIYVIFHLMTKLNDIACCCATYSNYMEYNNNENTNLKEAQSIERYLISFIMSIVSEINQTKF